MTVGAISAIISTIIILLVILVMVIQRRKKLLPKLYLPQGRDNTQVGNIEEGYKQSYESITAEGAHGTVWVSHSLTPQMGPGKIVYDLECELHANGYTCLSAILEKTKIAEQGFGTVYTLMQKVDQIVICCDREYFRSWTAMEENQLSAEEREQQQAFAHEHSAIITAKRDGYKRLVVVLLGDTQPDCIPLCLRSTSYYRFPDDKDFINLLHRLQNTEPIAPPGTHYDVGCLRSQEFLLEETTV
jgi:hypothetical protein